ncbi:c-type cytochrome [Flavobacterium sp. UBA6195]|uniref:c-type cytochrome n=1 Tax=Flavobacterium sp. UBA6195 TaxID=1946554 RepID=UPI0025C2B1E5|nr:c-type cytochrome [Flavobacterium sp. UBA6195]
MKLIFKSFAVFTLAISLTNCGEKKETDAYGNPVEEKTEVVTETTVDPLLAKGQELFEGKGTCTACHKPDTKVIGPAIKDIAKIYKEKGASIASFINEESEAIVDPTQYETMKANFVITKAMTAEERKALEVYMMSFE